MKIGIRFKLVVLLSAVALVPLLGALLTLIWGARSLRLDAFGRTMQGVAAAEVEALELSLMQDQRWLESVIQGEEVAGRLDREAAALPPEEIERLDRAWPTLPEDAPPLAGILRGPGMATLQRFRALDRRLAEVLITDRFGQLAGATGRSSDFFQADEDWWQGAVRQEPGRAYIPPLSYDESSRVWSVDLCLPIHVGSRIAGVAKAVIDITRWVGEMKSHVDELQASAMLVRQNGEIIHRSDGKPSPGRVAERWDGLAAGERKPGWRVQASGEIQAFSPMIQPRMPSDLPGQSPASGWLVLYIDSGRALGEFDRWIWIASSIGFAGIVVLFLAGLIIVDRGVVRHLLGIRAVARRIAGGDLSARIQTAPEGKGGGDEIDELSADFNHMAERVEKSHRALLEANAMKQDFIHVASHELKTPVSYILGMSQLLKQNPDPARLREGIGTLGGKAERLSGIIRSMFKLLQNGATARGLSCTPVDVAGLLEALRQEIRPFAEQRGQRLSIDRPERLPALWGDEQKLFDILENLLLNAIKFTPDGGEVGLKAAILESPERSGNRRLSFTVTDQGQGIPPKDLEHLFEPFFSGGDVFKHSSGKAGFEKRGMGLGLAIVKHFVELHGGEVAVETGAGGSAFTVVLPLKPPPSGIPPEQSVQSSSSRS